MSSLGTKEPFFYYFFDNCFLNDLCLISLPGDLEVDDNPGLWTSLIALRGSSGTRFWMVYFMCVLKRKDLLLFFFLNFYKFSSCSYFNNSSSIFINCI